MHAVIALLAALLIADITIDPVLAESFINRALENLQRHQNEDVQIISKDDEDDEDSISRSLTDNDLDLLELAIKANNQHEVQNEVNRKESSRKKKQLSHLQQLSGLGVNDVLVYNPESRIPIRTERKKNPLLDILASSKHANDATFDVENDNLPIYVIVKDDDIQSRSDDNLKDLLSSLLKSSSSNSQKERSNGRHEQRYKGFRVMSPYRRARDSMEKYDTVEVEDKRPLSRPRTYGGGGGRTPIPYIRHRGDIYEKDS